MTRETIKEITRHHRRGLSRSTIVMRFGFELADVDTVVDAIEADELREAADEMLRNPPAAFQHRLDEWRLIVEANFGKVTA